MAGFADLNVPQGPDKKSLQSLLEAAAHRESLPWARRERAGRWGRPGTWAAVQGLSWGGPGPAGEAAGRRRQHGRSLWAQFSLPAGSTSPSASLEGRPPPRSAPLRAPPSRCVWGGSCKRRGRDRGPPTGSSCGAWQALSLPLYANPSWGFSPNVDTSLCPAISYGLSVFSAELLCSQALPVWCFGG